MAHTNTLSLWEVEAGGLGVILSYIVSLRPAWILCIYLPASTPKIKDILGLQKENGYRVLVPLCFKFTNTHQFCSIIASFQSTPR